MVLHDPLSLSDAAALLGVSADRVRALIASGELRAHRVGSHWLVERGAAQSRKRAEVPAGRPLSQRAAWGALAMLDGRPAPWLSPRMRARLCKRLASRDLRPVELRRRAHIERFRVHSSKLDRALADPDVRESGVRVAAAAGLDLLVSRPASQPPDSALSSDEPLREVYVDSDRLPAFISRHKLVRSPEPNLVVRVIPELWPFADASACAPPAAIAVDLLESDDERARRAGREYFDRRLRNWSN
jgi:excisionase family DNA binding protein